METTGAFVEIFLFCFWGNSLHRTRAFSFTRFLAHTQLCTTFGRTLLDEWSALHRNLYLTIYNTHNRQKFMPLAVFEPTFSAGERPQNSVLDSTATGTGDTAWHRKLLAEQQEQRVSLLNVDKHRSSWQDILWDGTVEMIATDRRTRVNKE
jgi:hypothetical protein